jgi:peptidoglycan-N-acetylglucosamine deacetylase
MDAMLRAMVFVSAAGKALAVVLWAFTPLRWTAAAFFFLPDLWFFYQIFVPSSQGICRVFTHFVAEGNEIWLTIDDGPDAEDTPRILDVLDRHQARATFFLIGERAAKLPELVVEILKRGHQVGHHTHTHPMGSFWCASPSRVRVELDDGLQALRVAGASPRWFRAPVGIKSLFLGHALRQRGLHYVGWTIRSLDTVSRDPEQVAKRVADAAKPGSILLMHEGPSLSPSLRVKALEMALERLSATRISCVLPSFEQLR